MKYIANILSDTPFFENELYNVVSEYTSLIPGIPTLIIGWEMTKELYPDASIIEWEVEDNVYWTYGKFERRDKYEANIKKFQDFAFKKFIDSIGYVFYDVILSCEEKFQKFINAMKSGVKKTVYVSADMMYVYFEQAKNVFGVSLRDCDYIDESLKKRIFSTIYGNENINYLKNTDNISKEVRFKTRGKAYILPYIYS